MFIKVLCDDRFDKDLTYEIKGEKMRENSDPCEKCEKYSECMGFAKMFNQCTK